MKTKNIYQCLALLAMALTTATCQNELNEETTDPQPDEKVNMTIRATQGMTPQTRTIYTDGITSNTEGNVVVKWEGADGKAVEYINVFGTDETDNFTSPQEFESTPSTISADGLSITFTEKKTTTKVDNTTDKFLAVYPASNCEFDAGSVVFDFFDQRTQTQDCQKPMAHLKNFDIMIGKPAATGTSNYTFDHKAIMLRFDLTLSEAEEATKVTLATTGTKGIAPFAYIMASTKDVLQFDDAEALKEVSLGITNSTLSASLKAYMMVPYIDVKDATLTITVETKSGNTYKGELKTTSVTPDLLPGYCYTLKPTLAKIITVTTTTEGGLKTELDKLNPDTKQTELAVTGTVNTAEDIAALNDFLEKGAGQNITTLDLSGITINSGTSTTSVVGFKDCTKIVKVILPASATAIGDNAFEGCTKLTTVTENDLPKTDPAINTRASMPSRVKTVGKSAFKGCISMTEMFLHSGITSVGNNAFDGCTKLKFLVFEGKLEVGTGTNKITLGTDIVASTNADLKIFLPAITDAAVATTYNTALEKPIYYNFLGYGGANAENKVNATNYTLLPHGNGMDGFNPGGEWGK